MHAHPEYSTLANSRRGGARGRKLLRNLLSEPGDPGIPSNSGSENIRNRRAEHILRQAQTEIEHALRRKLFKHQPETPPIEFLPGYESCDVGNIAQTLPKMFGSVNANQKKLVLG